MPASGHYARDDSHLIHRKRLRPRRAPEADVVFSGRAVLSDPLVDRPSEQLLAVALGCEAGWALRNVASRARMAPPTGLPDEEGS
jgi:hypothetical protein